MSQSVVRGFVWRGRHHSVILTPRLIWVTVVLFAIAAALAVLAMTTGRVALTPMQVAATLVGFGEGGPSDHIIRNIRLPRVVGAVAIGAALGVAGSVFQSVSRNTLGSPDVIGFTTGAATGALAQIVFLGGGPLEVSLSAVAGGLITALVVYLLSMKSGVTGSYRLILTGIGIGALLAAINNLMLIRGELDNAIAANFWLAGSLNARTWLHIYPVLIGCLIFIPVIAFGARRLSIIEMGDDLSKQLGVRVEATRIQMMISAVLLTGLATAAAGPIAFVALAAPQLALRLTASRSVPVFSAAAMGAVLLTLADLMTQIMPFQLVVPVGRMTGIVGGLYLIWVLTRTKKF